MEALSDQSRPTMPEPLSSPDSHPCDDGFTIEMSDLMLPASDLESELFGMQQDSSATVVSTASSDEIAPPAVVTTTTTSSRPNKRKSSAASERRHSLPSTLLLSHSPLGEAVTQPVPEFLCHLFSMLRDPSYADLISWQVPSSDEPDHMGGGIRDIGKIVVHKPETLQESVLGRYYRHSKYASFQRQLNYFGFKKRLHGGKKGKLSPCSYIHEMLTEDVGSLFTLKRRPPAKKRASVASASVDTENKTNDCAASVISNDDTTNTTSSTSTSRSSKKRRVTVEKKSSKKSNNKKNRSKKDNEKQGKRQVAVTSMPIQVQAEEFSAPFPQTSAVIETSQYPVRVGKQLKNMVAPKLEPTVVESNASISQQPAAPKPVSPDAVSQPTLLEMLSTSLPPSEVLFNDELDMDSLDDEGIPTWVTDDGKHHYHNVDSSLVDLAMLY